MKVINNKNLRHTKIPGGSFGPGDIFQMDTKKMLLLSFKRLDKEKLVLNLQDNVGKKNAYIRANNDEGEKDLDFLENKLGDLINKSYNDILHFEIN